MVELKEWMKDISDRLKVLENQYSNQSPTACPDLGENDIPDLPITTTEEFLSLEGKLKKNNKFHCFF